MKDVLRHHISHQTHFMASLYYVFLLCCSSLLDAPWLSLRQQIGAVSLLRTHSDSKICLAMAASTQVSKDV
jgi:hypothetical protein